MTMKTEITSKGWKTTIVKKYNVSKIAVNFLEIEGWIDFTKRYIKARTGRNKGRFN